MSTQIDPDEKRFVDLIGKIRQCTTVAQVSLILNELSDKELSRFDRWLINLGLAISTTNTMIQGVQLIRAAQSSGSAKKVR